MDCGQIEKQLISHLRSCSMFNVNKLLKNKEDNIIEAFPGNEDKTMACWAFKYNLMFSIYKAFKLPQPPLSTGMDIPGLIMLQKPNSSSMNAR